MRSPAANGRGFRCFLVRCEWPISALLAIGKSAAFSTALSCSYPNSKWGQRSIGSGHSGCSRSRACAHWYRGTVRSPRQQLAQPGIESVPAGFIGVQAVNLREEAEGQGRPCRGAVRSSTLKAGWHGNHALFYPLRTTYVPSSFCLTQLREPGGHP